MLSRNTYPAITVTITLAILAIVAIYLFTLPYMQLEVSNPVPNLGGSPISETFDSGAAAELAAARWGAMGEAFAGLETSKMQVSAEDQIAYRWRQPARYYESLNAAAAEFPVADTSTQRWQAMGEIYVPDAVSLESNPELRAWRSWQANYGSEGPQGIVGEELNYGNSEVRLWRAWQANYGSDGPEAFDIDEESLINTELRIWQSWQENYK